MKSAPERPAAGHTLPLYPTRACTSGTSLSAGHNAPLLGTAYTPEKLPRDATGRARVSFPQKGVLLWSIIETQFWTLRPLSGQTSPPPHCHGHCADLCTSHLNHRALARFFVQLPIPIITLALSHMTTLFLSPCQGQTEAAVPIC
uniref:Uncharacterized protein n=1 Tax=Rhipicephalus zambeziensis TaxID=60191 RepID=A0A224YLS0_9ACAR